MAKILNEINFYEVDEGIIKAMAPLLLKILDEKKRAIIFIKNIDKINEVDSALWSYGRSKFIPHITILDKDFELTNQPIIISHLEENINNADYLIFLDEPSPDFVKSFTRAFYFFESQSNPINIKPNNFYRKISGKWTKIS